MQERVFAEVDRIGSPTAPWTREWLVEKTYLVDIVVDTVAEGTGSYHHPWYPLPSVECTYPAAVLEDLQRTVAQVLGMLVAAGAFAARMVVVGPVISRCPRMKETPMVSLRHCPS